MRPGPGGGLSDAPFSPFDLQGGRKVVVAVSGGSDSLALLLLARDALPAPALLAVTVDHGLRAEAADEARTVAALCRDLGVEHRTMVWCGEKPRTGLIAAAREARYRLLAGAADGFGADIILTAHTMNDQAETVAMRQKRGEGAGLAAMAAATLFDGRVWIARPLLGVRREALRDFLRRRGVAWTDDPTNEDTAYERVRTRMGLNDADVVRLAGIADAEGKARAELSGRAAGLVGRFVTSPAPGLLRLDPQMLRGEDEDAALRAFRVLLAAAGGASHPPDTERSRALLERLKAGRLRATLSRAAVDARSRAIWVLREGRGLPALPLDGGMGVWDGRWRIEMREDLQGAVIGPSGGAIDVEAAGEAPASLVRAALSREPMLIIDRAPLGRAGSQEAGAYGVSAHRVVAPFALFLPAFDLALADAVARVTGAPPPREAPWNNHIERRPSP